MADSDAPNAPENIDKIRANGASPQPAKKKSRKGKPGGKSPAQRGGAKIDRNAPMRQSRILAMQALFEDDLTEHGLEDILQHIGEQARREHGEYFSRIRVEAQKAQEELRFLARNADMDEPDQAASLFHDASVKVLGDLFAEPEQEPESADNDVVDEHLARVRARVEKSLKDVLLEFCAGAEKYIQRAHIDAQRRGEDSTAESLSKLEARSNRTLEEALASEERTARETLMETMRRSEKLARGVREKRAEIDPYIVKAAPAFPIPQLASIDRGVLRVAMFELLYEPDVPFKAVINEAVEIAKRFGGPNSGRFVNGVLRTISERLPAERKESKPRS